MTRDPTRVAKQTVVTGARDRPRRELGIRMRTHIMTAIDPTSDSPAEKILRHCIESLTEVLSITSPANMARVERIRRVSEVLGGRCGVTRPRHLARLAFASQLGTLSLPESVALKMHYGHLLTDEERRMMRGIQDLGGTCWRGSPVSRLTAKSCGCTTCTGPARSLDANRARQRDRAHDQPPPTGAGRNPPAVHADGLIDFTQGV